MTLSPNARNTAYVALVVLNTSLTICAERNVIPAGYAHCSAIVSLIVAGPHEGVRSPRSASAPRGAVKRLLVFVVAAAAVAGCAILGPAERAEVVGHLSLLERCQEEGRTAAQECHATGGAHCDPRAIAAYDACKRDAGIP